MTVLRRRQAILLLSVPILTSLGLAVGQKPANADGTVIWSLSNQAGYASGLFTSNLPDHYWHVSGKVRHDGRSSSCYYIKVSVPYRTTYAEKYRKTVCKGGQASFDWAGKSLWNDNIRVSVCADIVGSADVCRHRYLDLT